MPLPTIGITMGDTVGIGPEIIVNALAPKEVFTYCRPLVFGDANVVHATCNINSVRGAKEAKGTPKTIDLTELSHTDLNGIWNCQKTLSSANNSVSRNGLILCHGWKDQGDDYGPINKGFLSDAGYPFTGHTDFWPDGAKVLSW